MSRYRAPQRAGSPYITGAGMARVKAELDDLHRVQRPEVVTALAAAAAEGDRSENAEYQYRKRQLAAIDRRLGYLSRRIPTLRVVDGQASDPERVYFGAWVDLRLHDNEPTCWRVVGPDEVGGGEPVVSIDAPLARAILGHRIGERLTFDSPEGPREVEIVGVRYGAAPQSVPPK